MAQDLLTLQEITKALAYLRASVASGKISTTQAVRHALDIGFSEGVHAERTRAAEATRKAEEQKKLKMVEKDNIFRADLQNRNEDAREKLGRGVDEPWECCKACQ